MLELFILGVFSLAFCAVCADVFGERGLESLRIDLLDHLALLTARGLPLAPGIGALAAERGPTRPWGFRRRRQARSLQRIAAGLHEHGSLALALEEAPGLLARDQLALVEQAEAEGCLPAALDRLYAEERERDAAIYGVLETGFYAGVLSCFVLAITAFLTLVVMPKFVEIEASMGVAPSGGFDLLVTATWAYVGLCLASVALFLPGRLGGWLRWHAVHRAAALPGVGRPVRRWLSARWLQRVAALLQHGATLPDALRHVASTPGSTPGQAAAAQRAGEGRSLGDVLEAGLGVDAPGLVPSLLLTVDRAGSLAIGWSDGAERLAARARAWLATWGHALRPLPIVLCAALVATHYVTMWMSIGAMQGVVIGSVW